jgi:hypothetical protein
MDVHKKSNFLYHAMNRLKIFMRPFYDNGSSQSAQEINIQGPYQSIYVKSKIL